MSSSSTVDIPPPLLKRLEAFRMAKRSASSAAVVIKIDKAKLTMDVEEEYENIGLEELEEELPENTPRFILLSYRLAHSDGRVSFPLVLVYWAPATSSTEMSTLYTSALSALSVKADVGKVVDMRDGTMDRKTLESRLGA
ncbi:glia maturation factor beta [Jaminaea rosea]|uniref:Glia maturation factor beta n=1 Tax=Jaminaea rosea TaxID=1569628 RepID=A0A316UVQ5_9BASI|nr:glia maturation factor beta [Jaminaea rosea]PWN29376.1 glia maturation factor beta [Jaminaea rosea]